MADVIQRTTLEQQFSVNTPEFPTGTWIINPDLSAVEFTPKKYWKIVGDDVLVMTALEQAAVDSAELAALVERTKQTIKSRLSLESSIEGFFSPVSVVGLVITINVGQLIVDDETTIVADGSLIKRVNPAIIFNLTSDTFSIEVFEKTDGLYDDLAEDEVLAFNFGEWSVVASGTVLVPV